ncbi:50S ribosomal protein L5 [Patescibacteria group bacterium]|uniref:Large ribosomal subunit protein uL5 n=1 Tax=candidate division WWE3 bacterium TaxID=2053526 RepID=A0A928TWH1_UNCKA|nr:50S ribosomal protein L5 [candidate division WWE3 bacterium]MCL4732765.1 50S ribosomal protein L5 [Patescibacteria group bacterium]MDL1952917.1 50S ribosomal protein L5 [Candidatus Uhrbacteria bacterium UHB]RIL00637.1 MAG: 50S ribosomal protein L5 [Candidatus Uhrbacteria bacterium]
MPFSTTLRTNIAKALQAELGLTNVMAIPTVKKVTLSVGISPAKHKDSKMLETAEKVLARVTGQKPVRTKAKKSISNFKIRQGQVVGLKVTLRGQRMWDFVGRLVHVAFPRVRDFRGIPESVVDAQGNLSYGLVEHLAFPEVRPDEIEQIHGLQVTITTNAETRERGLALFRALGFPFQK